jgi:CubicO group peptidase (beta-lactamase class C family)
MSYSSIGYALAGAAIERITKRAWEDAMRTLVFSPLAMTTAGFGAPEGAQPRGHRRAPPDFATLSAVEPGPMGDNAAVTRPAGGVHLSLKDYGAFLALFLGGRPGFLSKDSLQRLTQPRSAGERPYALGWGLRAGEAWAKGPLLVHDGSNTLWHAAAQVAPGRGLALVAVANSGPRPEITLAPPQPGDAPGTRRYVGSPSASPGPARVLLDKLKPLVA